MGCAHSDEVSFATREELKLMAVEMEKMTDERDEIYQRCMDLQFELFTLTKRMERKSSSCSSSSPTSTTSSPTSSRRGSFNRSTSLRGVRFRDLAGPESRGRLERRRTLGPDELHHSLSSLEYK